MCMLFAWMRKYHVQTLLGLVIYISGVDHCQASKSFEGYILTGVPEYYNNGVLKPELGKTPLRLLTQRPESGGVGDAMGKLVTVFEIALRAINLESSILPDYVVELYLTDSRCAPQVAVQNTLKVINKYPRGFFKAVFGPLCSDPTAAVNDVVQAFNLFQVASISRSPTLSNGLRYPYICRLSPPLQFVADGIVKMIQLFGWTRVSLVQDHRSLSSSTVTQVYSHLKEARRLYDVGDSAGYAFDLTYTSLHRYQIDGTTVDEKAVVAAIKAAQVRVLVGALYEDVGMRFWCEVYKQGYYGKKMQFILATGWWADVWIAEQVAEQSDLDDPEASGGNCTAEDIFVAAQHTLASVAQTAWFQSPGKVHEVSRVDFAKLKQDYLTKCTDPVNEGCHNDFAAADYDGLATMVSTIDKWLADSNHNLSQIDYDNPAPVEELYDIALKTNYLGVTGQVKFYSSDDLACERQGSFTVKQYSNLPKSGGEDGWTVLTSFTNSGGFGELQTWTEFKWQDNTSTYFGDGKGFAKVSLGKVASFGNGSRGAENVLIDWMDCPAGQEYDSTKNSCLLCKAGSYGDKGQCIACRRGTYAANKGSAFCVNCPPGHYTNETGAVGCNLCPAGTISNVEDPSTCAACPPGRASEKDGLDECAVCDAGTYQDSERSASCKSCVDSLGDPYLWTTGTGATMQNECVCKKGYYRKPLFHTGGPSETCRPCPEGMTCPEAGSSYEALAALVERGRGVESNETGLQGLLLRRYPLLKQNYMSLETSPLEVFMCVDARHCPGGRPGHCGVRRNPGKVACARCINNAYENGEGTCEMCRGGTDAWVLSLFALGGVVGLFIMTMAVNRNLLQQQNSLTSIFMIGTIMFTGIQTLGVFHNLQVMFVEPLKAILSAMNLASFDLDMLKISCVYPFDPVQQYLTRQLVVPIFACVIFLIVLFKKQFVKKDTIIKVEFLNTLGTICSVFFLSISVSAVAPFVCYVHPSEPGEPVRSSVLSSPSVLCWNDSRHTSMALWALASTCVLIAPLLAWAAYGTWMYPKLTARMDAQSWMTLWMFRWLFFRFRPEIHYYGLIFLARNLLICMVPVVCGDDKAFQVILMCMVLIIFVVLQVNLRPWKAELTNVADSILTCSLLLLLICGALSTDFIADSESIQILGTICFSAWCLMAVASFAWLGYGKLRAMGRKPFQFFLCHHKAGTGSFARLLKMHLIATKKLRSGVFIDSDDLKDLDCLFDYVGSSTDTLVVLCSKELLMRPWCLGEIVTARAMGVKVVKLIFPDYEKPGDEFIENYTDFVGDLSGLSSRNICLSDIQETIRWLQGLPEIIIDAEVTHSSMTYVAEAMLRGAFSESSDSKPFAGSNMLKESRSMKESSVTTNSHVVVIVDHTNMESAATGQVLCNMLAPHMVENPTDIPKVLPRGETIPAQVELVLIVCTSGAFQEPEVLQALLSAAKHNVKYLPIIAADSFRFPTGAFLEEHRAVAQDLHENADVVLNLIADVFKSIAAVFQPADYSSTELILKSKAAEIAGRVKDKGKLKALSLDSQARLPYNLGEDLSQVVETIVVTCAGPSRTILP